MRYALAVLKVKADYAELYCLFDNTQKLLMINYIHRELITTPICQWHCAKLWTQYIFCSLAYPLAIMSYKLKSSHIPFSLGLGLDHKMIDSPPNSRQRKIYKKKQSMSNNNKDTKNNNTADGIQGEWRRDTQQLIFWSFFFVSIKNPFALFIFFFRPTSGEKKSERRQTHTAKPSAPHHFYPFFSFLCVDDFRPTGISWGIFHDFTDMLHTIAAKDQGFSVVFFSLCSFASSFHTWNSFLSLFTPQPRTSFWVWVFFFFFQPT